MPLRLGRLALLACALLAACASGPRAADFTLVDDNGAPWRLSEQHGKALLLTFGYTHCADTCPATLAKLVRTARALGPRSRQVEIVFVTVDPRRDSPDTLRRYVERFDRPGQGRLVALGGSPAQIAAVEKAYHVWSQVMPVRHGGYDVAHGAAIFLIDGDRRLRGVRDDDDSQASLVRAVEKLLG
jgi:protein SCO1